MHIEDNGEHLFQVIQNVFLVVSKLVLFLFSGYFARLAL